MSSPPESSPLSSEPELQYPKLSIHEPFSAPQTPTLPPSMDTDSSSDATHDSLADSSYEIISQHTADDSDEDSRRDDTDSLVSFTESSQDDAVNHTEPPRTAIPPMPKQELSMYDTSEEEDEDEAEAGDDSQKPQNRPSPEDSTIEDSCMTSETITQTPLGSIMFEEPRNAESEGPSEVVYTLPPSKRPYIRRWTDQMPGDAYRITIRQKLSPEKLRLDRSFRIVYHGNLKLKEEIIGKIAQALSVSTLSDSQATELHSSSSRYNIVQLSSFGSDESSPEVTLIPSSGLELVVEDCALCSKQRSQSAMSSPISTKFVRTCPNTQKEGHCPDLAIYCHSSLSPEHVGGENGQESVSLLVRSARTAASGIPVLDIMSTEAPCIMRSFRPFNGSALHMCVETQPRHADGETVISRMPIPVEHFLDVDARQINRNLACIIEPHTDDESDTSSAKRSSKASMVHGRDPVKTMVLGTCSAARQIFSLFSSTTWFLLSLTLLSLLMALVVGPSALHLNNKTEIQAPPFSLETTTVVVADSHWTVRETAAPTAKPETSLSIINTETGVQLIASSDPVASPGPDRPFKILLLESENGQLYLKLPAETLQGRRSPQVFATASTRSRPVHASLKKLDHGLYALDIDADRSRWAVDVMVWTDKKPNGEQYFRLEPLYLWPQYRKLEKDLKSIIPSPKELSRWAGGDLKIVRKYVSSTAWASSGLAEKSVGFLRSCSSRAIEEAQTQALAHRSSMTRALQKASTSMTKAARSRVNGVVKSVVKRMDALQTIPNRFERSVAVGALKTAKKIDRRLGRLNNRISKVKLPSPQWPTFQKEAIAKARTRAKKLLRKAGSLNKQKNKEARKVRKTCARERPAANRCDSNGQRCENTRPAYKAGFRQYR